MDPSNCIVCSRYQIVGDCVYLSYLNTHTHLILDRPDGLQPCKKRGARNRLLGALKQDISPMKFNEKDACIKMK